jgi:hypothetical protein
MRSLPRHLIVVTLAGLFVLTWRAETDQDVAVAQARTPVMMTRIYTGPDGLSHAEEVEVPRSATGAYAMMPAAGVQFSSRAPSTSDGEWHTGPGSS